ncbi:alpha/beta hydrolase [Pelagicoccus mobilis]|uniref:Alpha/beta hydrolase n=1 Tax=Pelagicoccus mobilis TaxID=415221 RepID=A0A934VQ79_9BACT|nr:alpha/beta hydrolase [Pelagicoccus mobilis]MBK1876293.1 alpha/beta hydrolase [Pelagicoccus mobilis]
MAFERDRERRGGLNTILVLVSVCVLFFYLFANVVVKQNLFVPGPASYELEEGIRMVQVDDEVEVAVFWGATPGAKKTVFYFHGNAEDIGDVAFILNSYRLQGVNVLCFDYRGYGLSGGTATERNSIADANAVLDYAISNLGVDPDQVVFHGRSLGGGLAADLAVERGAAGLILESTFLSVYRLYLPMEWLPGDKFTNYKKVSDLECPTFILHGREDQVVPFQQGETLAELVPGELLKVHWFDGVGHNDLVHREGSTYWAAIRAFLAEL